ncbi:MAG: ATP-binding cassette domain-containing protein, partial [Methanobacterium sp.]
MKNAIETFNLTKQYDDFMAVEDLNMKIREKSIFGFLGPNGAGKTTTIKMLTCLIFPTSGTASVAGYDVLKNPNEVRQKIGMVPQLVSLYGDL